MALQVPHDQSNVQIAKMLKCDNLKAKRPLFHRDRSQKRMRLQLSPYFFPSWSVHGANANTKRRTRERRLTNGHARLARDNQTALEYPRICTSSLETTHCFAVTANQSVTQSHSTQSQNSVLYLTHLRSSTIIK